MNTQVNPISDHELHAYVDGELDMQRHIEVEAWLASHPEAATRVREYQMLQTRLHEQFDPVLTEPIGVPTGDGANRFASLARAAAVTGLMLVSGLIGWSLNNGPDQELPTLAMLDLVQPATFAHQVYSSDTRYPVEIPAVEQATLNRWVSLRMHTELQAPDLAHEQLTFLGGRLLPSTNRMAAQFMYEDAQGQRVTLYVRRIADAGAVTDFQYKEQGNLHIFYWIDASMGYAVIGELPAARLIAVANAAQAAFNAPVMSPQLP